MIREDGGFLGPSRVRNAEDGVQSKLVEASGQHAHPEGEGDTTLFRVATQFFGKTELELTLKGLQ